MNPNIIAWDGEGIGSSDHRYVLLANSLGQEIRDERGLRTTRILKLLCDTAAKNPGAWHILYGASYDWEQWLRDLDYQSVKYLYQGYPIHFAPYNIKYNGVWLEIKRRGVSVTFWDVYKFWGYGFEAAVRETFPDSVHLPVIEKYKALRGEFTWDIIDEVADYNRRELVELVRLGQSLLGDLKDANINLPDFPTGAGSLAASLLKMHGVKEHLGNQTFGNEKVWHSVLGAYAAGRIDIWKIGVWNKPVYLHDIRSAYPRAMWDLPSMKDGYWEYIEGPDCEKYLDDPSWKERLSIWHVEWDYRGYNHRHEPLSYRYYPFFYRTKNNNILFPPCGSGWQWWPEVVTARNLGWKFDLMGGWIWHPENNDRPFYWIPTRYYQRAKLKADGKQGAQRELKYALNAAYGKVCQSAAGTYKKPPPFQNLAWAGWTTSATRARLMAACQQNPDAVIYQMTDSICATEELDLDFGDDLGQWELSEYDRGLFVQAGVGSLWLDKNEYPKYRGFDQGIINSGSILEAWKHNAEHEINIPLQTTVRRLITMGTMLTGRPFETWGTWQNQPRDLNLYGGDNKRDYLRSKDDRLWETLCDLEPSALIYNPERVPLSCRDQQYVLLARGDSPWSNEYEPKFSPTDPWKMDTVEANLRFREKDDEFTELA